MAVVEEKPKKKKKKTRKKVSVSAYSRNRRMKEFITETWRQFKPCCLFCAEEVDPETFNRPVSQGHDGLEATGRGPLLG